MSESDPSGYHDSPDTTDGAVTPGAEQAERSDDDQPVGNTTLTTDDDAQRENSVERPGNEPD